MHRTLAAASLISWAILAGPLAALSPQAGPPEGPAQGPCNGIP